jgi:hypothetical protein
LLPAGVLADEAAAAAPKFDTGDTADAHELGAGGDDDDPGPALFYGGLVCGKNVLSTLMHSFFALLISLTCCSATARVRPSSAASSAALPSSA